MFYQILSVNQSKRLSYKIRYLSNNPINLLFKIDPIIINHFKMRMSTPLVKCLEIQSPSLLNSFIPMLIILTSIKLLGTQSCSSQMDDQIIPLIGNKIHWPNLLLHDCLFVILSAISKVITNSSVTNQNYILILKQSQFSKISLQVHLLLTN